MALTNFPDGVSSFGMPVVGSGALPVAVQYYFVHSGRGSNAFEGSFENPFGTIDFAIGKCTANRGDVIVVLAGHAETLTGAGGITADVAGISIIGIGNGSDRPEVSFGSSAGASVLVTAANVTIKNIVGISAVNLLTNPFHIQAANCNLDIEWQDPSSSLQAIRVLLSTAACTNLRARIAVRGVISGGTAPVNVVRLVGTAGARIELDAYGRASTAMVEFHTTLCSDVLVTGYTYNSGTTDGSKNVIDTATNSLWFAVIYDGSAGAEFSGGSAAAIASDDVAAINAKIGTITNTAGTATIGAILGDFANTTLISKLNVPSADAVTNVDVSDVVGNKTDAAAPIVGATASLVATLKGLMQSTDRTVVKSDGAVLNGADALFTVAGGPIKIISIVGRVTTIIGGAANGTLQATTTVPASTTAMSTTVAVDSDAAGTVYTFVGPTGVLTPTTAGVVLMDYGSTTVTPTQYIVNPGTIEFLGSAAQSGVIEWTMHYVPMSPSAVVTAAA